MAQPKIEPISDADLPAFAQFLSTHLNPKIPPELWADAFRQKWGVDKPNNGFLIRDEAGAIVGGIGAIYAAYPVKGKREQFCNITSWLVLDKYRAQSMRLALALTTQPGFHFTDLSPTAVVEQALRFLKFKPMTETRTVFLNLPTPQALLFRGRIESRPAHIEQELDADSARLYRDHKHFPWLRFLALGRKGQAHSLVAYKRGVLRRMPCAEIVGFTNPDAFHRNLAALRTHFFFKGMPATRIETRLLSERPASPVFEIKGYRNRVFRSDTLNETDISNFYSEQVALDM